MTVQEFQERANRPFTKEDYEIIEKVYTFHPCIDEVNGKNQIAVLFNTFGIRVILDMLPTAEKAEELENEITLTKCKLNELTMELSDLKKGNI